ncbi:MAG: hypothetical protein C0P64_004900 [Bacillota bacterium]|nr:hypothetical protein [Bacillota bacterium]
MVPQSRLDQWIAYEWLSDNLFSLLLVGLSVVLAIALWMGIRRRDGWYTRRAALRRRGSKDET